MGAIILGFGVSCSGDEKRILQIDRLKPAKDRAPFSTERVEGEDCVGVFFPFYIPKKWDPDLQRAYDHAIEASPPGTSSIVKGEVFRREFYLPPLIFVRCIAIIGLPSGE
ncbi:hypothetical protein CH373_04265 [Leptospira perolatii]|uniref:Uncharacterized protein n=2 Tax=Leptospira perolatii TaxID=2023191 RepID=A0A2M9ZQY9_9LEPT|nr:hypothetical protein CH360_13065 [Leptospira perolatii]PJZ74454.1 hypothetical protein CH373_04265 [Leptospira perolatii]